MEDTILHSSGERYEIAVVDREKDVSVVTETFYNLECNRASLRGLRKGKSYKVTIPFAAHLFGSGKSTFVEEYLSLVRQFGDRSLRNSSSDPSKISFLENLKNAAFLYVTLKELEPTYPVEEKRNFKWAVYYLLIKTACLQVGASLISKRGAYEAIEMESSNLVPLLRTIMQIPTEKYLLIAFDEVGALEDATEEFDFKKKGSDIRPYNDFFGIIEELCKQENLFFIVVGKSKGLSIENYVSSVSRVLLKFIPLSPLEKDSIEEHLEKSSIVAAPNSPKVSDVICSENLSTSKLAEILLEFTGGVPGLLTRAVSLLLEAAMSRPDFSFSKEYFRSVMDESDTAEYCAAPYYSRLGNLIDERMDIVEMLFLFSLYHIRFRLNERVNVGSSHFVPLFDLVTEMGFYRREFVEHGRTSYEILIPKLLASHMQVGLELTPLDKILFKTLISQNADFFLASKCRVLEGLVAMTLYIHFVRHPVNSLLFSTLPQLSFIWNRMQLKISSDSAVYYMNSIHYTEAIPGRDRSTYGSNEWEQIVREDLEFEKIYIPCQPTSHSPDILFKLHGMTSEENLIVGVACKGRWSSKGIGWPEIVEEGRKFLEPIYNQVLSRHPTIHSMLIILSTKLASNVSTLLNHSSRCYSSGSRIEDFVVPNNCEIVILCEEDVEDFDRDILSALRNAFSATDDPLSIDIGISNIQNMESAVLQVLETFQSSYGREEDYSSGALCPSICLDPHMYGSGKSTFGQNFRTLLLQNRDLLVNFLNKRGLPGIAKGDNMGERALDALLNETLYVHLNLRGVPRGTWFQTILYEWISWKALRFMPNGDELLSQVLGNIGYPKEWLHSLLQVTQKRYLYLFIDEIKVLESNFPFQELLI
eukprot:jgi/Galph1/5361/GphlegSOOS_G4100.1